MGMGHGDGAQLRDRDRDRDTVEGLLIETSTKESHFIPFYSLMWLAGWLVASGN